MFVVTFIENSTNPVNHVIINTLECLGVIVFMLNNSNMFFEVFMITGGGMRINPSEIGWSESGFKNWARIGTNMFTLSNK